MTLISLCNALELIENMSIECLSIHVNNVLLAAETIDYFEMLDYTEEEEEFDDGAPIGHNVSDHLGIMDESRGINKPASTNNTK